MRSPTITHSAEELLDKLATLGSADQIASFLEEQKIVGVPCRASGCAIAAYLSHETGNYVTVGTWTVDVFSSRGHSLEGFCHAHEAVGDFIGRFDSDYYPNLIQKAN